MAENDPNQNRDDRASEGIAMGAGIIIAIFVLGFVLRGCVS